MIKVTPKDRPFAPKTDEAIPTLYIYRDVLEEIRFNGGWREGKLAAGILVGQPYACPLNEATYIEIEGFISGTHVPEVSDLTRYLRTQWKAASAAQKHSFPSAQIVGWYLATGADDLEIGQDGLLLHHTFFSQSWQQGLVMYGEKGLHALSADGDKFVDAPVATIIPRSE